MSEALAFQLPPRLEAGEPAEARGLPRDRVRMMVASRARGVISHARFSALDRLLAPGDLLVLNVSATLPSAVAARRPDGTAVRVHVSTRASGLGPEWRVVELRTSDGSRPQRGITGELLTMCHGGGTLELVARYAQSARLMLAHHDGAVSLEGHLRRFGEPISYAHSKRRWPLSAYQTVYATIPGSAEMASAGRPFTPELMIRLLARGVLFAPVLLHAGVSSPERHEPPYPEQFSVPRTTSHLVAAVRGWGGRVIAVGTTAVRALETAASGEQSGWTSLVIDSASELHAVDGMITGWHEPRASHLDMLEAVAGHDLLTRSYEQALSAGYLWHEFGDSHLILP
jgi:S-adenosylmethionine:tRNA ribosyltransferase-isomerase